MTAAIDFIVALFGITAMPVYVCSLANERDDSSEPTERHIATRDSDDVTSFISKWDRPKRGLFVCVSTVRHGMKRNKEGVGEIAFLHADIDFKNVTDEAGTILWRLKGLPLPPSIVVNSGNGLHCYWRFKESLVVNIVDGAETIERVESALKLLADLCGADQQVTQVVALMRLPGTHNSKRDEWKPVEVVESNGNTYELDDLETMLCETSPIILRKLRPAPTTGEVNPYLLIAEKYGFKAPVDVEKRLSLMLYMAGNEGGIHGTQLAVTASLLNAGHNADEVVSLVLEATRAASGEYGTRWNWRREEKAIAGMCATWVKKHPTSKPAAVGNAGAGGAGAASTATLHKLDEARAKKADKEPRPKSQRVIDYENLHILIGQTMLKMLHDTGRPVLIVVDQMWRYDKVSGLWIETHQSVIDVEIEICIRQLGKTSTSKLVIEVHRWIYRNPDIRQDAIEWDNHGKIAIAGGLIDPKTLKFEPAKAEHHVTAHVNCAYHPGAPCPVWLAMLDSTFSDRDTAVRADTIATIQEMLGMALVENKSKALSRALIFHGASNTGKTDLIKTLSGLLTDNPISTPIGALDGTHGLMEFNRKAPWILHEAFNGAKWHFSDIVKSILSGDPVQINIKNGALVTKRIRQPVIWGTNFPPAFREATRAMINRMVVIGTYTVFDPKEPVGVALDAHQLGYSEPSDMILATEKPGLLNWALAGLQRALGRGHFPTTTEMDATLEAIRTDSNIVVAFLEECTSYGASYMISTSDFCAAFAVHWGENKGEDRNVPSNETIGRALAAYADPRIGMDAKKLRDNKHRYYAGLHLNDIGLAYWEGASSEGLAKGKTARTSTTAGQVNRFIPAAWSNLAAVVKLDSKVQAVNLYLPKNPVPLSQPSVAYDSDPEF